MKGLEIQHHNTTIGDIRTRLATAQTELGASLAECDQSTSINDWQTRLATAEAELTSSRAERKQLATVMADLQPSLATLLAWAKRECGVTDAAGGRSL